MGDSVSAYWDSVEERKKYDFKLDIDNGDLGQTKVIARNGKMNDVVGQSPNYDLFIVDEFLINNNIVKINDACTVFTVEATEEGKSLEKALEIIDLISQKKPREVSVIGGGVTQDVASFACSLYNRGINWKFVPTTLAAMADSCIGGKTSINTGQGKNKLGTFHPASEVYIFPEFLETLNEEQISDGVGEMLHIFALTGDMSSCFELRRIIEKKKYKDDARILFPLIKASLKQKNELYKEDLFDRKGKRILLNYGHTFGHALEKATNYRISHGCAITWGMMFANRLSTLNEYWVSHYDHLISFNMPSVPRKQIDLDVFIDALKNDKKSYGTKEDGYICILPYGNTSCFFASDRYLHNREIERFEKIIEELECF